jgi:hypothetical protein
MLFEYCLAAAMPMLVNAVGNKYFQPLIGVVMHAVDDSRGLQSLLLGRAVGKAFYFVAN